MNCKSAVIDFLKEERNWIKRETLIHSLHSLGKHGDGEWPNGSLDAWETAVDELIESKEIMQSPQGLRWKDVLFMAPAVVERKTAKRSQGKKASKKSDSGQGMLF